MFSDVAGDFFGSCKYNRGLIWHELYKAMRHSEKATRLDSEAAGFEGAEVLFIFGTSEQKLC